MLPFSFWSACNSVRYVLRDLFVVSTFGKVQQAPGSLSDAKGSLCRQAFTGDWHLLAPQSSKHRMRSAASGCSLGCWFLRVDRALRTPFCCSTFHLDGILGLLTCNGVHWEACVLAGLFCLQRAGTHDWETHGVVKTASYFQELFWLSPPHFTKQNDLHLNNWTHGVDFTGCWNQRIISRSCFAYASREGLSQGIANRTYLSNTIGPYIWPMCKHYLF